jgi:hypothetical protein
MVAGLTRCWVAFHGQAPASHLDMRRVSRSGAHLRHGALLVRFVYIVWSQARVNIDSHIDVERHLYSVPHRLRDETDVRLSATCAYRQRDPTDRERELSGSSGRSEITPTGDAAVCEPAADRRDACDMSCVAQSNPLRVSRPGNGRPL